MSEMYVISIIQKKDDGKAFFKRCGIGWKNKDGSVNFKLDVFGDTQFHIKKAETEPKENSRGE